MTLDDLVKVYRDAFWGVKRADDDGDRAGIRAVLLWLAENVTEEMVDAADYELASDDSFVTKEVISAALRKAAGK